MESRINCFWKTCRKI